MFKKKIIINFFLHTTTKIQNSNGGTFLSILTPFKKKGIGITAPLTLVSPFKVYLASFQFIMDKAGGKSIYCDTLSSVYTTLTEKYTLFLAI